MPTMTGGEALVAQLVREGGSVVFGVPGVQLYGVMAALRDEPAVRFVTTRHEQSTTYMADGYARASGEFGTALVVPGPGLLNASAGISTAYSASSPVFVISGQVPKASLGRHVGVLHEVHDQQDCIAPITKWRRRVLEVADVPGAVHEAVRQLRRGRPRPVEIEMPPDTMESEGEVTLLEPAQRERPTPARAELERAAALLLAAGRPLIYAGGGVHPSGAHDALAAVADYLQAGVVQTAEGKGAISDASDLSLGAALSPDSPLRRHVNAADVVLVVASRVALAGFSKDQQVIQIDIDPDEIGRNHAKTLGLPGDARATLEELVERLRAGGPPRPSRKVEREGLRAAIADTITQEPQTSIIRSLRAGTPDEAIFVGDMTQIGYYARPAWPVYRPRTFVTSSYSGNLGYAYPTALGAKVACPDKPVIAICGDGGFFYNVQELSTAVRHGINVVAVVFNDNAYGNVARDLDEAWGGTFGADLSNPDFMKLADAFGVVGMRAKEPTDVGRLVRDAIDLNRPALIEVPVGRMPRPTFFAARKVPTKYQR
jgi:acetolactate synthase-1/2/3 large subunit